MPPKKKVDPVVLAAQEAKAKERQRFRTTLEERRDHVFKEYNTELSALVLSGVNAGAYDLDSLMVTMMDKLIDTAVEKIADIRGVVADREEKIKELDGRMKMKNEELRRFKDKKNEEIRKMNEELQKANDELQRVKEDLQTVNEDLQMANEELEYLRQAEQPLDDDPDR